MSVQVIAALRRRADALEAEARGLAGTGHDKDTFLALVKANVCLEFRKLANEAEGREPQTGLNWE